MADPIAAIDIGTQTFRLLIAKPEEGHVRTLLTRLENVRLGKDLHRSGVISPESMEKGLSVLRKFKKELERLKVNRFAIAGTQVLRQALNAQEFLESTHQIGLPVRVLSDKQEAAISLLGVKAALDTQLRYPVLVMDIGGGSSEFTLAQEDRLLYSSSFKMGAVTLTQAFVTSHPPDDNDARKLRQYVEKKLSVLPGQLPESPAMVVGVGGTATTLAAIHLRMSHYEPGRVNGLEMTKGLIQDICQSLRVMTLEQLKGLKGLEEKRADIIYAGTVMTWCALEIIGAKSMTVSDGGLLLGLLYTLIHKGEIPDA